MTAGELGKSLVERRRSLDQGEAEWLGSLVEFDRHGEWALDGHLSCVSWLVDKCGLGRSTAKEKLRIAHELVRRPIVATAYASGELSYSKIRAITRVVNTDEETDRVLVDTAQSLTAADLERVARHFELIEEQERPTDALARWERRGLRTYRRHDEMGVIEVVLPVEQQQRVIRSIDAKAAGDKASAETRSQRRAGALVDIIEAGVAHLARAGDVDSDLATVDVVVDYTTLVDGCAGTAEIGGRIPLSGEAARRLACDAGLSRIIVKGKSEVLDVGRRTRQWNRAQRRAIRFRHGGQCAFSGCDRTITQIHHLQPWAWGGRTDLDAGIPLCWGHHQLVHEGGWTIDYDTTTATATFSPPDRFTRAA